MTTSLILRSCAPHMLSYGDFRWPVTGPVEAPDWNPAPVCGGGLHGFLRGEGDGALANWNDDARWLVVEVETAAIVDLGGKVKFPRGEVIFCGPRSAAAAFVKARYPGAAVMGCTATAGDHGTATAGDHGTATAGYCGTATAGYCGTATAGDRGTATAGYCGTATAGFRGTATAGDDGTATAGDGGTATAGYCGTATAGEGGILQISYINDNRRRIATAYVGENGIKPNVKYRFDSDMLTFIETT